MTYRSTLRYVLEGFEGIGVLLCVMCTWPLSKLWLQNWGSHSEERERKWPGDALVSPNHETYTRAIDIAAPARNIWQ